MRIALCKKRYNIDLIETKFNIADDLAPYINCIMIGKSLDDNSHINIPLYTDGYPGIMFQQAKKGFFLKIILYGNNYGGERSQPVRTTHWRN